MPLRMIGRAALIALALVAGQGCSSPTDATPARCGELDLDDCRLAFAAALETVPVDARDDLVDWRLSTTQAATCREAELTPVLDVKLSFSSSLEPLVVTIGRDESGRARACTT